MKGEAEYRQHAIDCAAVCPTCAKAEMPKVLDVDGVRAELSGRPGRWRHAYEDHVWPCKAHAIRKAFAPEFTWTAKQYSAGLYRLGRLMHGDPSADSDRGRKLAALAEQLGNYERVHFPQLAGGVSP